MIPCFPRPSFDFMPCTTLPRVVLCRACLDTLQRHQTAHEAQKWCLHTMHLASTARLGAPRISNSYTIHSKPHLRVFRPMSNICSGTAEAPEKPSIRPKKSMTAS